MKSRIVPAILVGVFSMGIGSAFADSHGMSAMKLAEKKKCTACHTVTESDPMAVAPSFMSIAQRYSMEESDRLVQVVLTGGEDHWGNAEMPDMGVRKGVTPEEAEKLVQWVLEMDE